MKSLDSGFARQLHRLVLERRFGLLLLLLVGLSCLSVQIYRGQVLRGMPVAVVDLDNSMLSRRTRLVLGSMRDLRITGDYIASPDEARRLLTTGEVAAVVVIPPTFASDIKRGDKGEVLVAVDMSNILVGKNAHKAVAKAVGTVGAGVQLTTVQKLGVRPDRAMSAVVPVVVDENFSFNPATNYSVYIVPGLLFFLLHVYAIVAATSVMLPAQGPREPLAKLGAAGAVWLVSVVLGAAMLWILLPWAQIQPATGAPVLLALVAALVAADLVFVAAVFAVVPNSLMAMELTIVVAMLSLMLSGITWPTDMFPPWMQALSRWIPFTPFARGLRTLVHYPTPARDAWLWFGELARQTGVFALVVAGAALARRLAASIRPRRYA